MQALEKLSALEDENKASRESKNFTKELNLSSFTTWSNKLGISLQNLVVIRHPPREFNYCLQGVFNIVLFQTPAVSAIPLLLLEQYKCCSVGDFILGINRQFYNYDESFDKKRNHFFINDLSKNSYTMYCH